MKTNLLTSLRKYRPRENSDPLENFITEAFAWLLNNHPEFGKFILHRVIEGLHDCALEVLQNPEWSTQENFDGKFPDMFCKVEGTAFVFEHKAWSHLHANQLQNYRDFAEDKFAGKYHLILITGGAHLHDQSPDLALCWHNVYKWINSWLGEQKVSSDEELFILHDFLELLQHEGMGPPATISHEAILSYYPARYFRRDLSQLMQRVEKSVDWQSLVREGHFKLKAPNKRGSLFGDEWGRIGINLLDGWYPGVFVGFMLDEWDHKVEPLTPQSPDCSIIIDVATEHHATYINNELYLFMLKDLEAKVTALGWDFHNHIESHDKPNPWHPIHIRIPVLELFRGTRNSEEQDRRFTEKTSEVLHVIKNSDSFWELRSLLKEQS